MPVYRLEREMPARELAEWVAHFQLAAKERERELRRLERRSGGKL